MRFSTFKLCEVKEKRRFFVAFCYFCTIIDSHQKNIVFPDKPMQASHEKVLPPYCSKLSAERAKDIYTQIVDLLKEDNRYRDPAFNAKEVARALKTNSRYVSAAVLLSTGDNFRALVNGMRLNDACKMLRSPLFADVTAEEIGLSVGYPLRQSFYLAFQRTMECTPAEYRKKYLKAED